ncbi:MAG TPA: hypothetical protein VIM33_07585 [Gaiellaceae bacterium]|jgi:hypothetical protein
MDVLTASGIKGWLEDAGHTVEVVDSPSLYLVATRNLTIPLVDFTPLCRERAKAKGVDVDFLNNDAGDIVGAVFTDKPLEEDSPGEQAAPPLPGIS